MKRIMKAKTKKWALYILGSIIILFPLLNAEFEVKFLGFPDGGLTYLDRLLKYKIFPIYIGISIFMWITFSFLSWELSSKKKKILIILFIAYVMMWISWDIIDSNPWNIFKDGKGG